MRKAILATIVAVAGISGVVAYHSQSKASNTNMLTLANVEALSQSEFETYCNKYCENRAGFVCWVKTNYYTVYCDDMAAWND